MNLILINKWSNFNYPVNELGVHRAEISKSFKLFSDTILAQSPSLEDHFILFILKVRLENNLHRNISTVQFLTIKNILEVEENLIEFWNLKSEEYTVFTVDSLIYNYKI